MIFQLKVQIKGTKPAVWRRLQVDEQMTFNEFHKVLQVMFGWDDYHFHGYQMVKVNGKAVSGVSIGIDEDDADDDFGFLKFEQFDERVEKLVDWFLIEKDKGLYTYDFLSDWSHEIVLEKRLEPEEEVLYPLCLKAVEMGPEENNDEPVEVKVLTSQVNENLKPLTKLVQIQPDESDVWKRLVLKMKELNTASPWSWINDDQVFIVEDPISKENLFVSVLGGGGQEFGLVVYVGQQGYRALINTLEDAMSMEELVLSQRSILASFEDRSELEPGDYKLLKTSGITFRGKKQWPQFRSFKPGDYPWAIDEEEVLLLTLAIEQTLVMLRKVKAGLMLSRFLENGEFFARVLLEDGSWEDGLLTVQEVERVQLVPTEIELYVSELELKRVKKLSVKNIKVEFDVFYSMFPLHTNPDERPFFPFMAVAMDAQEGSAIYQNMFEGKNQAKVVQLGFINMMVELGYIPREVWVKDEVFELLQPVLKKIKVNVTRVEELEQVERLKIFLAEMER